MGKLSVKLERHTEFYTCTISEKSGKKTDPLASAAELLQTDDFVLLSNNATEFTSMAVLKWVADKHRMALHRARKTTAKRVH